MVLEYLPTFALKITQFCRKYTSTMVFANMGWGDETPLSRRTALLKVQMDTAQRQVSKVSSVK